MCFISSLYIIFKGS